MRFFIFLCTLSCLFAQQEQCYFTPPAGWEIAQLKVPSPHVKVGFLGQGTAEFRPSINLATEEVDVSLKEYLKAVKELQKQEGGNQWRDLGKFSMKGGMGHLVEMTQGSPHGEMRILQAFLLHRHTIYILTAAVLKEDLSKFQAELLKSLQSLTVIPDVWTPIADAKEREMFQTFFRSLGTKDRPEEDWEELQKKVKQHGELGPYWEYITLLDGHTKIYPQGKPK